MTYKSYKKFISIIILNIYIFILSLFIFTNSYGKSCNNINAKHNIVTNPVVYMGSSKELRVDSVTSQLQQSLLLFSNQTWMAQTPPWSLSLDPQLSQLKGVVHPNLTDSDGRPVILMNPTSFLEDRYSSLLAHELIHILHKRFRPNEQWWVKEGVATLGQHLLTCKYSINYDWSYEKTDASLTFEPKDIDPTQYDLRPHYSLAQMYFLFIYKSCGAEDLFLNLLNSSSLKVGVEFIDTVLKRSSEENSQLPVFCSSFADSFKQFQIARYRQNFFKAEEHIMLTKRFGYAIYESRQPLAPYSAIIYEKNQKCDSRDIDFDFAKCLQIRWN